MREWSRAGLLAFTINLQGGIALRLFQGSAVGNPAPTRTGHLGLTIWRAWSAPMHKRRSRLSYFVNLSAMGIPCSPITVIKSFTGTVPLFFPLCGVFMTSANARPVS